MKPKKLSDIEAFTFDAGHTLLKPAVDPPIAYAEVFRRHGHPVSPEAVYPVFYQAWRERDGGKGFMADRYSKFPDGEIGFWRDFVYDVMDRLGLSNSKEACFQELRAHYTRPEAWEVFKDVPDTLKALTDRGYVLGVVSNWDTSLLPLLEKLHLAQYFHTILMSAKEGISKPQPDLFRKAAQDLKRPLPKVIHIGDSLHDDYWGAIHAGLQALLLVRQGSFPEGVRAIQSLQDLLEWLS